MYDNKTSRKYVLGNFLPQGKKKPKLINSFETLFLNILINTLVCKWLQYVAYKSSWTDNTNVHKTENTINIKMLHKKN